MSETTASATESGVAAETDAAAAVQSEAAVPGPMPAAQPAAVMQEPALQPAATAPAEATTAAPESSEPPPQPQPAEPEPGLFQRRFRHRSGRRGRLVSVKRDRDGKTIVEVRLQIGREVTEWLVVGDLTAE